MSSKTTEETGLEEATATEPAGAGRAGRRAGRLVLESAIIVLSVFLAFGLNEWRQHRADRVLATTVLVGFKHEIQENLTLLERFQPQHLHLARAIAELPPESLEGRTAFDVISENRTDDGSVIMPPAEAAWQTAVSTGSLALLDYETAAILSRIYFAQQNFVGRTGERLTDLVFDGRMFDAEAGVESLAVFLALMQELAAQETSLMGEYRNALERLSAIGI
jgi:hypothetical protein